MPTAVIDIDSKQEQQQRDFTRAELAALEADDREIDQPGIAAHTGYKIGSVKLWRTNGIRAEDRGDPAGINELPPPDKIVGGKPIWYAYTVNRWGRRVGRLVPGAAGPEWVKAKPPGRPRNHC